MYSRYRRAATSRSAEVATTAFQRDIASPERSGPKNLQGPLCAARVEIGQVAATPAEKLTGALREANVAISVGEVAAVQGMAQTLANLQVR